MVSRNTPIKSEIVSDDPLDQTVMPFGIGRKITDPTDDHLHALQRQGPLLEPAWLREAIAAEIRRRNAAGCDRKQTATR